MFNKENLPINNFQNYSFPRSPLKDFPINTFNFLFSTRKKTEKKDSLFHKDEKKLNSINKYSTAKKSNNNVEITNKDLFNIFEALNKTIKKENLNKNDKTDNILLNKKRKRKFITINSINKKKKFINYKLEKNLIQNNNKNKISVLTYNILNPACVKKESLQNNISTDERMQKIKKEILKLSPDVFCLQEADIFIYKKYLTQCDMNKYDILYGINCGSSFINIIGYKKEKFILKSFKNFSLSKLGKYAGNRGIMNINLELIENKDKDINTQKNQALDINEMIEILPKNINKKKNIIYIYNVHFPWKYENDRIILLDMLFRHIKENDIKESDKNKILILGDFNSEPNSQLIKLFYYKKFLKSEKNNDLMVGKGRKTEIDLNTLYLCEEICNKFNFKSAYQNYTKERKYEGEFYKHPAFTSRTKYFKKTIDYIFFSDNLKLRKILKLPHGYEVDKEQFLPSKQFPSDHLKLYAEFFMK